MTSVSPNVYIDKLDDIVNKYNNTYTTIKMKPTDVTSSKYINFGIESNNVISGHNGEGTVTTFYKQELQKLNQKEFRIKKYLVEKTINCMENGKVMIIHLIVGLIKRYIYIKGVNFQNHILLCVIILFHHPVYVCILHLSCVYVVASSTKVHPIHFIYQSPSHSFHLG